MRPQRPPATVESIKEGCARLASQLASLEREVSGLSDKLNRFKRGREIPDPKKDHLYNFYRQHLERRRGESAETPDPASAIADLEKELNGEQLAIAAQVLIALGKELDGAVREVRAAKATLQAIADDSDLRAEFKDWQNRGR